MSILRNTIMIYLKITIKEIDKIKQKFQVAVRCMTYNHSKYITDTMNGFAMHIQ